MIYKIESFTQKCVVALFLYQKRQFQIHFRSICAPLRNLINAVKYSTERKRGDFHG